MSLKDNIEAIKEELSTEEKFLESMIKGESFFKKNKKLILLAGGAILVGIIASSLYNYKKEMDLKESNEIYIKLLSTKDDKSLESQLKSKNPNLYMLYKFQKVIKKNDIEKLKELSNSIKDPILKDLVSYQIDSLSKKDIMKYVGNDGALKEFALLQQAFIELENKNYEKANEVLDFIPINSPLHQLASALKHYNKKEEQ